MPATLEKETAQATLIEKENWNNYFKESLEGEGQEHENALWWNLVDRDCCDIVLKHFAKKKSISVLEPGCGSAKTTFHLAEKVKIDPLYLMDVSEHALRFAKTKEHSYLQGKVTYAEQDIFHMEFDRKFDLVWNVGLIEHYTEDEMSQIVRKMFEYTASGGALMIAIPNRRSIPVLKAAILGSSFGKKALSWIPGYRNETENLYGEGLIKRLIEKETRKDVSVEYAGSPTWVDCPEFLVKFFDRYLKLKKFAFLTFFIVRK